MKEILFLVHRIPYPPNKGDKIRSFHFLKFLADGYRVHLGAFVDDPEDWRHAPAVREYCAEACLLPLRPFSAKLRSLRGLLSGEPLSLPYYRDSRMSAWVDDIVKRPGLKGVLVFSSAMAQYAEGHGSLPRIIDFVDVDSDKWRQYAAKKPWPANWIYSREAERLFAFDRGIAQAFEHSLFVSRQEADLFLSLAPETSGRVSPLENGVDTGYFRPDADYPNPYPAEAEVMVFTGAMDYWANGDAVVWFADEVFPELRRRCGKAEFYVVGSRPTEAVSALGRRAGVTVTGAVPDIRPYLRHARFAVAPLRIARGVQNKVLEALAMAKLVLASPAAMEGIEADSSLDIRIAERAEQWHEAGLDLLREGRAPLESVGNRDFVVRRYGWARSLNRLGALLESL
jgi:sugar transferase (PEP-CTERM/EpsH1 system associated)